MTRQSIKSGIHDAHERVSDSYGVIPPDQSTPDAPSYDVYNFDRNVVAPLLLLVSEVASQQTWPSLSLIDAGSGNGQIAAVYAGMGIGRITAIDFSMRMLRAFQNRFLNIPCKGRYQRVLADIEFLDGVRDETADIVNFFGVIEHLDSPEKALGHTLRILKRGGVLIMGVPRKFSLAHITYGLFGVPPSDWGTKRGFGRYLSFREKAAYYRYYSPAQVMHLLDLAQIPYTIWKRIPFAHSHMDGISGFWLHALGRLGERGYHLIDRIEHLLRKMGAIPGGEWWMIRRD